VCGERPAEARSVSRKIIRSTTTPPPRGKSGPRPAEDTHPLHISLREAHRHHASPGCDPSRSEELTSELQSPYDLVCRLLLEKKKQRRHLAHDRQGELPGSKFLSARVYRRVLLLLLPPYGYPSS